MNVSRFPQKPLLCCTAGIIRDVEGVRHLAELGVVFLLFNIGLELSLERLQSMQKFVFGLGAGQVLRQTLAETLAYRCRIRMLVYTCCFMVTQPSDCICSKPMSVLGAG